MRLPRPSFPPIPFTGQPINQSSQKGPIQYRAAATPAVPRTFFHLENPPPTASPNHFIRAHWHPITGVRDGFDAAPITQQVISCLSEGGDKDDGFLLAEITQLLIDFSLEEREIVAAELTKNIPGNLDLEYALATFGSATLPNYILALLNGDLEPGFLEITIEIDRKEKTFRLKFWGRLDPDTATALAKSIADFSKIILEGSQKRAGNPGSQTPEEPLRIFFAPSSLYRSFLYGQIQNEQKANMYGKFSRGIYLPQNNTIILKDLFLSSASTVFPHEFAHYAEDALIIGTGNLVDQVLPHLLQHKLKMVAQYLDRKEQDRFFKLIDKKKRLRTQLRDLEPDDEQTLRSLLLKVARIPMKAGWFPVITPGGFVTSYALTGDSKNEVTEYFAETWAYFLLYPKFLKDTDATLFNAFEAFAAKLENDDIEGATQAFNERLQ